MSLKLLFEGQAVKSELVVLMLEKWELHPQLEEKTANANPDDLERATGFSSRKANLIELGKFSSAKAKSNARSFESRTTTVAENR